MKRIQLIAGVAGATAVALGAFGAHGLADRFQQLGTERLWQTASLYHLVHAVALLALALRAAKVRGTSAITAAWVLGIVGFSGALYLRALGGPAWLGMIAPIGGTSFIVGWVLVAAGFGRNTSA